ncbi:MAG: hypothetical protein HZB26_04385 [Candidatus Hydrogenedentes bacterium]|nr:hypothetical protein [Candidatus Hydrogenedentota bacterium]
MRVSGQPDTLFVVNGPEDGAEFPIVRAPFYVGQDPSCAVNLRLDTAIRECNALLTIVSEGYRVRRMDRSPVYVDGKRAGMFRSRIVRSGGSVQVGHTLLLLECSPDGLASRSHGIVSEGDFGWAVQKGLVGVVSGTGRLINSVLRVFGRLLTSWMALFSMAILLYVFWPWFHYTVNGLVRILYSRILGFLFSG